MSSRARTAPAAALAAAAATVWAALPPARPPPPAERAQQGEGARAVARAAPAVRGVARPPRSVRQR
eukprot:gene8687-55860_t